MKWTRELIAIFTVVALVMNLGMTVCASTIDTVTGKTKSQQIEHLHQELNDLAEEKYQIQRQKESSVAAKKESRLREVVNAEKNIYEELAALGVKVLDPENKNEMDDFASVIYGNREMAAAQATGLPSVSAFARYYTITEESGSVLINGTRYEVKTYCVTDDKGYGGLTSAAEAQWFKGNKSWTACVDDVVEYNFGFLLSGFLGEIGLTAADWLLGNIFTFFDSYSDKAQVTIGKGDLYTITFHGITQMKYHFIYWTGMQTWVQCGVCASSLSATRVDNIYVNVQGQSEDERCERKIRAHINKSVDYFARIFVTEGYAQELAMGTLTAINTWSNEEFDYTPVFCAYMSELL